MLALCWPGVGRKGREISRFFVLVGVLVLGEFRDVDQLLTAGRVPANKPAAGELAKQLFDVALVVGKALDLDHPRPILESAIAVGERPGAAKRICASGEQSASPSCLKNPGLIFRARAITQQPPMTA